MFKKIITYKNTKILTALKALEVALRGNRHPYWRSIALCKVSKKSRKMGRYQEAKGYALAALYDALLAKSISLADSAVKEIDIIDKQHPS